MPTKMVVSVMCTAIALVGLSVVVGKYASPPENEAPTITIFDKNYDENYTPPVTIFNPRPKPKPVKIYRRRIHVVEPGETLSEIATMYYGMPGKWNKILKANEEQLAGPEYLTVGMRLVIPR